VLPLHSRVMTVRLASALLILFRAGGGLAINNGVARTPPLGWSTWETCGNAACEHDFCTESEVLEVADILVSSGLRDLGWEYVNLDDCWSGASRDAEGALTWDTARFPSGIASLAASVHERGLKLGIYTSAGDKTCHNLPGSRGHYEADALTFASWGVDYIKFDWCGDIKDEVWLGSKAHRQFAAAVNATGRRMAIEVVAGYFFLGRETPDYAHVWRFCTDHHDTWPSTSAQLACRADQGHLRGAPGGWASMDLLTTGGAGCAGSAHCPGQSDAEYRTEFVLWSLTQSPLLVATDLRNMTTIMKKLMLNKDLVGFHRSTQTPPGRWLGQWPCAEPLSCAIWGRPVTADGSQWLVALVNSGNSSHTIKCKWKLLDWDAKAVASVRNVLEQRAENTTSGAVQAKVDPHDTELLLLSRAKSP
jgi:alpha-galactosidase